MRTLLYPKSGNLYRPISSREHELQMRRQLYPMRLQTDTVTQDRASGHEQGTDSKDLSGNCALKAAPSFQRPMEDSMIGMMMIEEKTGERERKRKKLETK